MANTAGRRQTEPVSARYRAPGRFTRNVVNRAVAFSTRYGVSILGSSRELTDGEKVPVLQAYLKRWGGGAIRH
jgi:transposase-like protein